MLLNLAQLMLWLLATTNFINAWLALNKFVTYVNTHLIERDGLESRCILFVLYTLLMFSGYKLCVQLLEWMDTNIVKNVRTPLKLVIDAKNFVGLFVMLAIAAWFTYEYMLAPSCASKLLFLYISSDLFGEIAFVLAVSIVKDEEEDPPPKLDELLV